MVVKSNPFNQMRRYSLTYDELRLIEIYLARVNPRDVDSRRVRMSVANLKEILGYSDSTTLSIPRLKSIAVSLLKKVVEMDYGNGEFAAFQLFSCFEYRRDKNREWFLEIDAHDKMLPYIFELKRSYVSYPLEHVLALKSSNQIRLYQLLKQYQKLNRRELSLVDLREMLGIEEGAYPRYAIFNRDVLKPCQDMINRVTDIVFQYTTKRQNRRITAIVFEIQENRNIERDLSKSGLIETKTIFDEEEEDNAGKQKPKRLQADIVIQSPFMPPVLANKYLDKPTLTESSVDKEQCDNTKQRQLPAVQPPQPLNEHPLWKHALTYANKEGVRDKIRKTPERYAEGILRVWEEKGYKTEQDLKQSGEISAADIADNDDWGDTDKQLYEMWYGDKS
jgi:plasmid replication initiation protein